MGCPLSTERDFDPALFHQKLSCTDWLFEIVRVDTLKAKEMMIMQQNTTNNSKNPDASSSMMLSSQPKQECLMKEKALKKTMLFDSDHSKLLHSPIDSLMRKTHSFKRNFQSINDDDKGIHWACKKQRSSRSPPNLMHSAALDSLKKKTNALKRNFQSIGDDDVNWAPVQYCKKQKMMMVVAPEKNNVNKATGSINIAAPKKKREKPVSPTPSSSHQHYHDLPEEFKTEIERLKGTKLALVIEKELTKTDLVPSGNRMSMPFNHIVSTDFLTRDESSWLDNGQTMTVQFIDPGLVHGDMNLRLWIMGKAAGREGSKMYVLRNQWGGVARRNQLKQGNLVQVWSFRVDDLASNKKDQLYLALVLVKRSGFSGDHDRKESDDVGCKSSVVDADQSGGGSQGEANVGIMQEGRSGGNNGSCCTSGGSSIVTNGLELDLNVSPSHQ